MEFKVIYNNYTLYIVLMCKTVTFYLSDYRSLNNAADYLFN